MKNNIEFQELTDDQLEMVVGAGQHGFKVNISQHASVSLKQKASAAAGNAQSNGDAYNSAFSSWEATAGSNNTATATNSATVTAVNTLGSFAVS